MAYDEDRKTKNVTQTAIEAGMAMVGVRSLSGGGQIAIVPEGGTVFNVEPFDAPAPTFVNTSIAARRPDDLIKYVGRHGTEATAIFADVAGPAIVGIIDYHGAKNEPARLTHRVHYGAPFSDQWQAWNGFAGNRHKQADFARFLEENRVDVVDPSGADLLEIVRNLEVRKRVTFRSGVRLDNGNVDLIFQEDSEGQAGPEGSMQIPTEIGLGIPVFYGGPPYSITAFFRYRIEDGKLFLWIDLHRKQETIDAAFRDIVQRVAAELPNTPLYEGRVAGDDSIDF